jgi:transcriptional regulator with XRE-family HTH domain
MSSNLRPLVSCREALLPDEAVARARFRVACHRLGLSRFALDVARACGCDESTVRRWYRGDVRAPACALVAAERLAAELTRAA